jgi:proline dehydrogenase
VRILTFFASRFVAGETPEAAIGVGRKLNGRGIRATFDLLGEDVKDRETSRRITEANKQLLRMIPSEVERNVSVKLTNLGLDVSEELCLEQTASVLDVAREVGGFVRVDMEGSKHTQQTLDIFRRLRKSHDNVGIVLQAMLRRTAQDVKDAIANGDRVRLCKGAYKEPAAIAFQDMKEIRASFMDCAHDLLEKGVQPAIATHDETLIRDAIGFARTKGIAADRFEFQMLYGLRPGRWGQLVRDGYRVRIYVPYGTHWLPYFYRRLREKKENVFFVLRNLFGG